MIREMFFLPFFLLSGMAVIHAQILAPIATDRPDQTECPFIVPKGFIQTELGITNARPSVLWKYGISDNIEFRLITEIVSEKVLNTTITGLMPVTLGFKVKIAEENGILPKTSFIGHLAVPTWASEALQATYYAPSFRFTIQHTLSDRLALAYNLGAEWDGETPEPTFIYTLTTGFSITEKLGSYIEIYGFAPQNQKADHRFDCGLTYLINKNVMIDISGGLSLTTNAPKSYFALGFSYRFDTKK